VRSLRNPALQGGRFNRLRTLWWWWWWRKKSARRHRVVGTVMPERCGGEQHYATACRQIRGGSTAESPESTPSGVGVYGNSTGLCLFSDNHTTQARTMGGWVKRHGTLTRSSIRFVSCFNSQLTGSAAPLRTCRHLLGVGNPMSISVSRLTIGWMVNAVPTVGTCHGDAFPFNITQIKCVLYPLRTSLRQQGVIQPFYNLCSLSDSGAGPRRSRAKYSF